MPLNRYTQYSCRNKLEFAGGAWNASIEEASGRSELRESGWSTVPVEADRGWIDSVRQQSIFRDPGTLTDWRRRVADEIAGPCGHDVQIGISLYVANDRVEMTGSDGTIRDNRDTRIMRICLMTAAGHYSYVDIDFGAVSAVGAAEVRDLIETLRGRVSFVADNRVVSTGPAHVLLSSEVSACFIHEVFGHMFEADFVNSQFSPLHRFREKIGDQIASPQVTILDSAERGKGRIGIGDYDDEGVVVQDVRLVTAGNLSGFLTDHRNAAPPQGWFPGCSRREATACRACRGCGVS